jgi:hypothetical protein
MMHHMSAVPLAVRAMPEAITFSTQLGFTLVYGSSHARFRTLHAGDALINLTLAPHLKPMWWGRTRFRVDKVESLYQDSCRPRLHSCCTPEWCMGRAVCSPHRSQWA